MSKQNADHGHFVPMLNRLNEAIVLPSGRVCPPRSRPVWSDNQNWETDACTLWSLLILSCFPRARAVESLSETIKLLRSQRIAPSLLRHIFLLTPVKFSPALAKAGLDESALS